MRFEKYLKKTLKKLLSFFYFAFGLLFCQNIIVPIKIGSTPFNVILFLSIIFLVLQTLSKEIDFFKFIKRIPASFYIFLITIVSSIISGLIGGQKFGTVSPMFKGLLFFTLNGLLPLAVGIVLKGERKKKFFAGLLTGFIMNVLVSVIVFIAFKTCGYVLSFNLIFINDSFFEPNYFTSAQGLFLEPSHFAGFIMVSTYLLIWQYKDKKISFLINLLAWISFLLYGMGNFLIFVASQILFLFINFNPINFFKKTIFGSRKKRFISLLTITILLLVFTLLLAFPFRERLLSTLKEFNPFGSENKDRMKSIAIGLNVFFKNPFGTGFNLSGTAINYYYGNIINVATTHSYLLKLLIELGPLGTISFIYFVLTLILGLKKKPKSQILIVSILAGTIFAFFDGPTEPYLYLLYGISIKCCLFNTNATKDGVLSKPNQINYFIARI